MKLHRALLRSTRLTVMAVTVVLCMTTCSDDDTPTCPKPNTANLVTYLFAIQVTEVIDNWNLLGGAIEVDDILIGSVTWDRTASDTCSTTQVGCYRSDTTPCGMSIKHNGLVFATDPANVQLDITIANDFNEFYIYEDYIVFKSYNNLPVVSQGESFELFMQLRGDTTPLDNADLPSTLPDLDVWTTATLYAARTNPGESFSIAGTVVEMSKP
jgi:hypothetical protein